MLLKTTDFTSGYTSIPNVITPGSAYQKQLEGIISEFEPHWIEQLWGTIFSEWIYSEDASEEIKIIVIGVLKYFLYLEWLSESGQLITNNGVVTQKAETGTHADPSYKKAEIYNLGIDAYRQTFCEIDNKLPSEIKIFKLCLHKQAAFMM